MALPDVKITLGNGNIGGIVATSDGTVGLVMTGATEGTATAGTPFLLSNQADITALGLTSANNALAVKTLKDFITEAADKGINQFQLYVMLVTSATKVHMMADVTNANGAKKLLDYAAGKIRVLGIITDDALVYPGGTGLVTTAGINADCYTAIANLQTLCTTYATANQPLRGIVAGTSFTGTAANLTDQTANSKNRVSCLIGDTVSGAGSAIGVLLGRIAAIPVQRKTSRVKTGPIASTTAFVGTADAATYSGVTTVSDKNFITFRAFANKSGYYFSGDPTCVADTDDYSSLARGRVIDKAQIITYAGLVEEIDDEVPIDAATGNIAAGYAKWLEQQIINEISLSMLAAGEISGVSCNIDTNQNIVSTGKLAVVVKIVPVGYSTEIDVLLSYSLTA